MAEHDGATDPSRGATTTTLERRDPAREAARRAVSRTPTGPRILTRREDAFDWIRFRLDRRRSRPAPGAAPTRASAGAASGATRAAGAPGPSRGGMSAAAAAAVAGGGRRSVGSTGSPTGRGVGSTGSPTGRGVGSVGSPTEDGVGSTGSPTGRGVGSTGSPTGRGVGSTGSSTGRGVGSVGSPTGRGVGSTGSPTGDGLGSAGSPTGDGVGSAGASTEGGVGAAVDRVMGRVQGAPVGRTLAGGLLVAVGIGMLLGWVVHVSWTPLVDALIVAIGIALVIQARYGVPSRPLIALAVVLTVLSVATWRADVSLDGGLGRRTVRPPAATAQVTTYRLGTGQLTIDLRTMAPSPEPQRIRARVGVGRIVVKLPPGAVARVHTTAGLGQTIVVSDRHVGPGTEHTTELGDGPSTIRLDLRVGVGTVEVQR